MAASELDRKYDAVMAAVTGPGGRVVLDKDEQGRTIDVSLVESSIAAAAWEAAGYLATGEVPQRIGHQHRLNAPYQLFETEDRQYLAIGTPNDELFRRFMHVLGLESHIADPRFGSYPLRKQNEAALLALVSPAIRSSTAAKNPSVSCTCG